MARVIREVLAARPTAGERSFANVIDHCSRSLGRHGLLFFVSDFASTDLSRPGELPEWSTALSGLARRHDIVYP